MRMNLKRSRKSNTVSWAPGVNLCQVKLFSSKDCPVEVSFKHQDNRQAKASSMLLSVPVENDLPPGFEGSFAVSQSKLELSHIPRVQWQCSSKFVMSCAWQVAAGEESEETKAQKLRESRVLEAVYPRFSAIPPNPSVSLDVEREHYDDSLTPSVPLTPIEEESSDLPSDLETPANASAGSQPPAVPQVPMASGNSNASKCSSPGLQQLANQNVDVTAAASAALTAIMKSAEKGSLVDTGLLIKILSDPKMVQKLINEHGAQANVGVAPIKTVTAPRSNTTCPSVPSSPPKSDMQRTAGGNFCHMPGTMETMNTLALQPNNVQLSGLNRPAPSPPLSSPRSNFPMVPRLPNQNQIHPTLLAMTRLNRAAVSAFPVNEAPVSSFPVMKDVNYYKNLIMQHGVEQEIQNPIIAQNGNNHRNHFTDMKMVLNFKPGEEVKPKNPKPCMYFKSSKGCRKGVNCDFRHDMPVQYRTGSFMEAHNAKRMKLSGVNAG